MKNRIVRAREKMAEFKLDALIIEDPSNIYYLSQFTGTTASVLITNYHQYIFVDFRYHLQALGQCEDFEVVVYDQSFADFIEKLQARLYEDDVHRLGFDGSHLTYDRAIAIKDQVDANFIAVDLIDLRSIKDELEIATLRKAIALGDQVYLNIYDQIKPGMREVDVVDLMHAELKALGASDFSFNTIVASGVRSSLPHGVASEKEIEADDIVTIDWGVIYNRYCSDSTRTFFMSEPTNPQLVEIYNLVLKANQAAIAAIKPGVSTQAIDAIARNIIIEGGYGDHFNHGTGHGLGIDIHEFPRLNHYSDTILKPNMVVTVEPGIYVEGLGGVRIEDVVLVTRDGYEVLTKLNKELQYKAEGSK